MSDMWALGVMVYELAAGMQLFDGQDKQEIYEKIVAFREIRQVFIFEIKFQSEYSFLFYHIF